MEPRPQIQTWLAEDAGERWQRSKAMRAASHAAATKLMFELASIAAGQRVLDVAAGTGDTSIEAAQLVGPAGYVLATDLSAGMLKAAAQAAREAGLSNVETKVVDAQELDLPPGSFDAAICRNGLMFIPDRQKALTAIRQALKPGAKIAAMVWSAPEKNPWLAMPRRVFAEYAGQDSQIALALSMGERGVFEQELAGAGFQYVTVRAVPASRSFPSLAQALEGLKGSPIAQDVAKLPAADQEEVWRRLEAELHAYETAAGVAIPAESLVGVGTK
jgi:ubiquinone/menaquinone biosynthesis C-methylase UbiE